MDVHPTKNVSIGIDPYPAQKSVSTDDVFGANDFRWHEGRYGYGIETLKNLRSWEQHCLAIVVLQPKKNDS